MKNLTLFFWALLFNFSANAQDKIPSFGKLDKADMEMKDCDFDPGAEAVVLLDLGEISFSYYESSGGQSESEYRIRIKILKSSAVHRAEIKIPYYSKQNNQTISNISGISYNLDASGNIIESKLDKKAIYDKVVNKYYSEISFALPDVKAGTVFEYKFKKFSKSFGYIPSWTFQQSIPVRYSAYNIMIPAYFQFTTHTVQRQEMEKKEGRSESDGTWYMMRNVPGLKNEPYSQGTKDYIQRIEFQLSTISSPYFYKEIRSTWPKLIDELLDDEDFGVAIKKNLRGTDDLEMQVSSAKSAKEKIRIIYNYVQRNMQWNDEYDRFSDNGIKEAWDKKNGNITDINFILIHLLRNAGIDADPLLVSTKDNGSVNGIYPFLDQFNAVMTYVHDGDVTYIMNAADKYNPFNLVPYDILYTDGLLVKKDGGGIIALNSNNKYTNRIFFTCGADANGKLSGQATLNSLDYARNIRMSTFKKGKLKSVLEDNEGITIKIDSLSLNNEKDELLPLEQKLEFSGSLQSSGEYFFLPYNIFTGLGKNPFVEENRVMDIDFNFPKSYVINGSYILDDNYVVNELPKNTKMILPDTSIVLTRMTQVDGNIISYRFTLDFKASGYAAESYPYIKEFFKKMYNILEERIVIKKK